MAANQSDVNSVAHMKRPVLLMTMILLLVPLGLYCFIFYAQLLSVLMIQKALNEKGLSKTTESNLKKVYASNVMVLIIEGTSTLITGIIFMFLLVTFFMKE